MTIQAVDNAALAPVVGQAADNGIIVVDHYGFADELGISDKIYKVLFGQKESGIMEAAEYVKIGGESGKVAIIAGLTGADNAQQRTAGFEEELAKYPDIDKSSQRSSRQSFLCWFRFCIRRYSNSFQG